MLRIASATIFAALLVAGCGNARLVARTQTGGVFALQGDQGKAMEDAHRQMAAHCQGPYTIVREGETVVGEDTVYREDSAARQRGNTARSSTAGSQSTRQATEWRVEYVCGNAAPAPAAAPMDQGPPPGDPGAPPPGDPGAPPPPPGY